MYAYCTAKKADPVKAEKSLNVLLAASRLEPHVKVFKDEKSFFRRLDSLTSETDSEKDETVEYEVQVLKSLSM